MGCSSHKRALIQRFLRAALLAVAGIAMFAFTVLRGETLLSPRVLWRAYSGAAALYLLGVVEVFGVALALRGGNVQSKHTHRHHHAPVLWPLLLPFLLFPAAKQSSSAEIASNQAYVPEARPVRAADKGTVPAVVSAPPEELIVIDSESFTEPLFALFDHVEALQGRRVRITGFAHRVEGWDEDLFLVGRLLMWCCAADASLIGLPVRATGERPVEATWLEVEGRLAVLDQVESGGIVRERIPYVIAESIVPIPKPVREYAFPPVN